MEGPVPEGDFRQTLTPLQRFGADVRRVRLGRKLTQKQLGRATSYSEPYVSQVESGKQLPSAKFVRGLDFVFGTNGLFEGLLRRLEGEHPPQFVPYLQLEQKASGILNFSATTIMGMVQTEGYARAIFRAGHPQEPDQIIQGKVSARTARREVLRGEGAPSLWVVLHEACLRTPVGGPGVMAEQLEDLLEFALAPRADIQVIPYSSGAAAAHSVPFTLLGFADELPALYTDDLQGGRICRDANTVGAAQYSYDRLRAHALPFDESMIFISTLRKEYRSEC